MALPDSTYLAVGTHGTWQSPNKRELCVTLISAAGDSLWSRLYGDSLNDLGSSIVDAIGGYLAYGTKDMYSGSVPPRLFLTWDTLGVFTGIPSELVSPTMQVFPVPAYDRLCVRWAGAPKNTDRLLILDTMGRTLREVRVSAGNEQWIDVRDLANGCYLIRVGGADGAHTARFLIER